MEKLKYEVEDDAVYAEILWRTDRIAQHLHEYGLETAKMARANKKISIHTIELAAAFGSKIQFLPLNLLSRAD